MDTLITGFQKRCHNQVDQVILEWECNEMKEGSPSKMREHSKSKKIRAVIFRKMKNQSKVIFQGCAIGYENGFLGR